MKKVYLLILVLFVSGLTNILFAKIIRTEYKQGGSNTYKFEYTDEGDVIISNINNPFEKIPRSLWQEKIKIISFTGDMDKMVYHYIGPCTRTLQLNKEEYGKNSFYMSVDIGLDGRVKHITFGYSTLIQTIPLSTLEELEREIKQKHKVSLKYNSDDLGDVKYLNVFRSYSLFYIKEEQLRNDRGNFIEEELIPEDRKLIPQPTN